jgi:hypothetical protein
MNTASGPSSRRW